MGTHGLDMGTTLVALEFANNQVMSVNLGDSRSYFLRAGVLKQLSTDHTVISRMLATGQITAQEARKHPRKNELTQYLGINPNDMIIEPSVVPPFLVMDNDRYLICSDGLTESLGLDQIRRILEEERTVEETSKALLSAALENHARDNITVIVIQAEKLRETLFQRMSNALRRWH